MRLDEMQKEVQAFWQHVDKNQLAALRMLQAEKATLNADLEQITEKYSRISRVTLPMDEVNILHRRIRQAREDMPEKNRKTSFPALFFLALLDSRRIKTKDAQLCEYLITYKRFQRKAWQRWYKGLRDSVDYADPDGPELPEVWDYYTGDVPLYNKPPCDMLDDNAAYYMRRYRDAPRPEIDKNNQAHRKIVEQALADILKRSPATGNYYGILDRVYTYELGVRRVDELKRAWIEKVRFVAVLDNATTDECRDLHGRVFRVEDLVVGKNAPPINPPPHPCRSRLMALP